MIIKTRNNMRLSVTGSKDCVFCTVTEKQARRAHISNSSEGLCEKFPGTSSKSLEEVVVEMELGVLNALAVVLQLISKVLGRHNVCDRL